MATVQALIAEGIERLRAAGSETPRLDVEVLLGFVLGLDRTAIAAHPEGAVGDGSVERFHAALRRREAGEPVAYIRGVKEFHGIALAADARALIPRPETELLVDLAVGEVVRRLTEAPRPPGSAPVRVLDVGTGSGAVAIALSVELRVRRMADGVSIVATDLSADALKLARENAVGHAVGDRIAFELADLVPDDGRGSWDLVLANLPYVRSTAMAGLPVAAAFEPALALDGGPDGLAVIGRLLDRLPRALAEGGIALIEIGADQVTDIVAAVAARLPGWSCVVVPDLARLPRVARVEPSARVERAATAEWPT